MRTKGKAGYRVWKLAGGQGDQDINLSLDCIEEVKEVFFFEADVFVANPLLIFHLNHYLNKNKNKSEWKDKNPKTLPIVRNRTG